MNAGREFEIRAMSGFRLAGNRAGNQTPVHFRENHIHGEIGGAKATRIFLPLRLRGAGENRLQDRRIGAVENARFRIETGRKACCIDDHIGFFAGKSGAHPGDGVRVLQTRDEDRGHAEPARGKRIRERANRRRVPREHEGTVKDDKRGALGRNERPATRLETACRRNCGRGRRLMPCARGARAALDEVEKRLDVFCPAMLERGMNMAEIGAGQCRGGIEPWIFHRVARHDGKREIPRPRRAEKFLDTIPPIVETAEETDHHEARVARGLLDI